MWRALGKLIHRHWWKEPRIQNLYKGRSSHYHHLVSWPAHSNSASLSLLLLPTSSSSCCPGLAVSVCHPLCSHQHSGHTSKPQLSPSLIQGEMEPETPSPVHNVRGEVCFVSLYVCTRRTIQFCRTVTTAAQRKAGLGAAESQFKGCFTQPDCWKQPSLAVHGFKYYSPKTMTCNQSESNVFTEALFIHRHLKWILFSIIIKDLRDCWFLILS